MDWIASIIELVAKVIVGNRNRIGYIIHIISAIAWGYVCVTEQIYGMFIVLIPSTVINIWNYHKWNVPNEETIATFKKTDAGKELHYVNQGKVE